MRTHTVFLCVASLALLLSGCNDTAASSREPAQTQETIALSATTTAVTSTTPVAGAVVPGATTADPAAAETTTLPDNVPVISTPDTLPVKAGFDQSDLKLPCKGVMLAPDMDLSTVLGQLGTPDAQFAAPSCAYEGDDKTFTFGDMTIYTYPAGSGDIIDEIEVKGKSVTAPRGGRVGMTQAEITAIYGSGFTTEGSTLRYVLGKCYLYFYMDGGVATAMGVANL